MLFKRVVGEGEIGLERGNAGGQHAGGEAGGHESGSGWVEKLRMNEAEGISTSWRRATLLVLAITLHNIPEGLAVGVSFGAAAIELEVATGATLAGAVALAIGIGLQNFPEGVAVAMPLRGEGVSQFKRDRKSVV